MREYGPAFVDVTDYYYEYGDVSPPGCHDTYGKSPGSQSSSRLCCLYMYYLPYGTSTPFLMQSMTFATTALQIIIQVALWACVRGKRR